MKQSYRFLFTFSASLAAMAVIAGVTLPSTSAKADPEPTESPTPGESASPSPTTSPSPSPSPTGRYRCCATIYQIQWCGDGWGGPPNAESNDPSGDQTVNWNPGWDGPPHIPSDYEKRRGFRAAETRTGLYQYEEVRAIPDTLDCNWNWDEAAHTGGGCSGPGWTSEHKIFKSEVHIGYVTGPLQAQQCVAEWDKTSPWKELFPARLVR